VTPESQVSPIPLFFFPGEPDRPLDRPLPAMFTDASAVWRRADYAEAAAVVFITRYDGSSTVRELLARARADAKPCLFMDWNDAIHLLRPDYGVVYRASLDASNVASCERAIPAHCEDLLRYNDGRLRLREKTPKPVVGFCGYVSPLWKQVLQRLRGDRDKVVGHAARTRAIRALWSSPGVQTRFIIRRHYAGGALAEPQNYATARRQFVENLFDSDYALCVRGAGNFSIRFYEALSAGRVPLLIDTRCVLPFANRIDWQRHCVIVAEQDIARAGERLADFHARHTPQSFTRLQEENRALWETHLSSAGFLSRLFAEELGKTSFAADRAAD